MNQMNQTFQNGTQDQKKIGDYIFFLSKRLGSGQFGQVYLGMKAVKDEQKKYLAVKVVSKELINNLPQEHRQLILNEISVLKVLHHENLINMIEFLESQNNYYLIFEFCNGGDLGQYIKSKENKKLSHDEAVQLFREICAGYQAIYKQSIIHRDIKPENILLHDGHAKLGDFGFGKILDHNPDIAMKMTAKYTPVYASPQIIQGQAYSSKTDVWSLGVLFHQMLYGFRPFDSNQLQGIIDNQKQKTQQLIKLPNDQTIAKNTIDILQKMLVYDELKRISWSELFQHSIIIVKQQKEEEKEEEEINQTQQNMNIYTSIRKVKKDGNVIIDKPFNQQAKKQIFGKKQLQETISENDELLQDFQNHYNNQNTVQKMDKLVRFQRNQSFFIFLSLNFFLDSQNQKNINIFKYPQYMETIIIYLLSGYCYNQLDFIYQVLTKQIPNTMYKDSYFNIYLESNELQQRIKIFQQDIQNIQVIYKDINNTVSTQIKQQFEQCQKDQSNKFANENYKQLIQNVQAQQQKKKQVVNDFLAILLSFINNSIKEIDLTKQTIPTLKSLYSLQIISQINKYIPTDQYQVFDFQNFYNCQFTTSSDKELINKIKTHIQNYP